MIGLSGGIASGKSTVASMFQRLGATVFDADVIGHEVLKDDAVKQQAREFWGDGVFDDSGEIDRKALAAIVFDPDNGERELMRLEQITHPRIRQLIMTRLDSVADSVPAAVLDAALLLKAGWDDMCDRLVFVDCDLTTRLKRAAKRGWSREHYFERQQQQLPLAQKRDASDHVVDSSENLEQTWQQIVQLWKSWKLPESAMLSAKWNN